MPARLAPATRTAPRMRAARDRACGVRLGEATLALEETGDGRYALASFQIAEDERPLATHALGVACHDAERSADMGGEVRFVDDQQVRAGDAWAALARNFFTLGDIDHVNGEIGELRTERGGEIIAARFDQHQV